MAINSLEQRSASPLFLSGMPHNVSEIAGAALCAVLPGASETSEGGNFRVIGRRFPPDDESNISNDHFNSGRSCTTSTSSSSL